MLQTRIWSWEHYCLLLKIHRKCFMSHNKRCLLCSESKDMTQKHKTVNSFSCPPVRMCQEPEEWIRRWEKFQLPLPYPWPCPSQFSGITSRSPLGVSSLSICFFGMHVVCLALQYCILSRENWTRGTESLKTAIQNSTHWKKKKY